MSSRSSGEDSWSKGSSERWGKYIFKSAGIGVAIVEPSGRFITSNSAYHSLTGYTEAELLKMTALDLTVEADRAATLDSLGQLAAGVTRQRRVEKRYRRKDGGVIWVRVTFSMIPDGPRKAKYILVVAEDITQRKRAENELRTQHEILQKVFDHLPLMINVTGKDGRIRLVNPAWERTLGWTLEEIESQGIDVFAECYPDPRDRERVVDFIAAASEEWADFKPRVRDGRTLDTMWTEVRLSDGTTIGIGVEITARKRAEERLRRSEAYLEESERLGHFGAWALDVRNRRISYWSKEHYNIYGFDPAKGIPTLADVMAKIHPEDNAVVKEIVRAANEKDAFDVNYRILLPGGSVRYIRAVGRPVLNDSGETVEFNGISMDVTDRKLAEDALQRSLEQSRALAAGLESVRREERERLAREIHDELGQALTAIKMEVAAFRRQPPSDPRERARLCQSTLELIDNAIQSVRRISEELRPPAILDELGLVAAVEWAAEDLAARSGMKYTLKLPPAGLSVSQAGATALFRILQEALTNIARHAEATEFSVRLAEGDGGLYLEIRDNGRGVGEERIASGGSLGILGMRERAMQLGGRLTITNLPGNGVSVTAWIPTPQRSSASG